MTTDVRDNPTDHRYELVVDGSVVGFADYQLDGNRIAFLHTEVEDAYTGQGLGRQLVTGLLDDAERRDLRVVPLCHYVRKVISRNADQYLRLVPEEVREDLGLAGR